MLLFKGRLD